MGVADVGVASACADEFRSGDLASEGERLLIRYHLRVLPIIEQSDSILTLITHLLPRGLLVTEEVPSRLLHM